MEAFYNKERVSYGLAQYSDMDLFFLGDSNSFSVRKKELLGGRRPPQESCAGLWPAKIS